MNECEKTEYIKWIVIFLIIGISICIGISWYSDTDIYINQSEFEEFAYEELANDNMPSDNESGDITYSYNNLISTAIRIDNTLSEDIKLKEKELIDKHINQCINKAHEADSKAIDNREKAYADTSRAILVDTAVTSSNNGTLTIAVYTKMYRASERSMKLETSLVDTMLLSSKTHNRIDVYQAMNLTYRYKAFKYIKPYFLGIYAPSDFVTNWEDKINPDYADNYMKFIMSGDNVRFFFDEGLIVNECYGVSTVDIPNEYMDFTIREAVIDRYINPDKPMVAITYDDGPGDGSEKRILNCLEKYDSVATFFYVGYRVQSFAYNGRRAAELGCEIGSHTWDHPTLTTCDKKKIKRELSKTNSAIKKYIGVDVTLLRPPYGDYSERVGKVANMPAIMWTIDTLDWKTRNPKKIFKSVKNSKNLDGSIILMHSIYDETAAATEKIVPWLRENGYQTVTISELIKYKTGENPKPKVYRELY